MVARSENDEPMAAKSEGDEPMGGLDSLADENDDNFGDDNQNIGEKRWR